MDHDSEVATWNEKWEAGHGPPDVLFNLVSALRQIGHVDGALSIMAQAKVASSAWLLPERLLFWRLECELKELVGRRFETVEARRLIAKHDLEDDRNLFALANVLTGLGEIDEALAYTRQLLSHDQNHLSAAANYLLYINYSDRMNAEEISNEHFRMGMRFTESSQSIPKRKVGQNARVRVGYLSADFYLHPVGKLMLPVLESHDRGKVEVIVYHDSTTRDHITDAVRSVSDRFFYCHQWSDSEAVEKIREHELDILIDLGGYTGGGNRLQVLAKRVAPLQASFLGYPNTSALRTIDFHLTDRYADPPGLTEHLYGEKLVWLNHSHVTWKPYACADQLPEPRREGPVLGLFNNVAKISPSALEAYAMILRRVPEAKLLIKYGDRFGVPALQDRYHRIFAHWGVLPHRLVFYTKTLSTEEHLALMASVDLRLTRFLTKEQ